MVKLSGTYLALIALFAGPVCADTGRDNAADVPRTTWIQQQYERSSESDGSSSSSSGRQTLIETIIEDTPDRVVVEYDLPRDADGSSSSNFWYFPARVVEYPDGKRELADRAAIEKRIEEWIAKYGFPRDACGQWNHGGGFPFKIDCDPDSIFDQIDPFILRIDGVVEGQEFTHHLGLNRASIERAESEQNRLVAIVDIDPAKAREAEVEQTLILAQMMGDELSRVDAEQQAAQIDYRGTITTEFELSDSGKIVRKIETSEISIARPSEPIETVRSVVTVSEANPTDL